MPFCELLQPKYGVDKPSLKALHGQVQGAQFDCMQKWLGFSVLFTRITSSIRSIRGGTNRENLCRVDTQSEIRTGTMKSALIKKMTQVIWNKQLSLISGPWHSIRSGVSGPVLLAYYLTRPGRVFVPPLTLSNTGRLANSYKT